MLAPLPVLADSWRPAKLWAVGDEKTLWVVGASAGGKGEFPAIQMWCSGRGDQSAVPKQLSPVTGDIVTLAADAEALRVLYSDLSVRDYFGDQTSLADARWRDQTDARPLAWGGDSSEAIFWALVDTSTLKPPATQEVATSDFSPPATAASQPDAVGEPSRLTLLELRNGRWNRLPGPDAAADAEAFWIAGRKGAAWLFWHARGLGIMASSCGRRPDTTAEAASTPAAGPSADRRTWSPTELVTPDSDIRCGWAGASAQGLVFIAGRSRSGDGVQLDLYVREHKSWASKGPARDGTELLEIDPRICGVGVARGQIVVVRPGYKGRVELGLGDVGVSPAMRFSALPSRTAVPDQVSSWQQTLVLAVVLALVTMALWARRERVVRPALLPPGIILAPVWRRLIATIIDAVPAMVAMMPFVLVLMPDKLQNLDWSSLDQLQTDPDLQAAALPINLAFVFCYALWCFLWELALGSTPGKLLLGCRVAAVSLTPPTSRQILVRNLLRMVEVGLGSPGWIVTLMILVLLTRNRQRIGDVLADTIVITRAPASSGQFPES